MNELKLYKFFRSHNVSSYRIDQTSKGNMYIVWIYFHGIEEFIKLIGVNYFGDGGYEVRLQENCIAIDLNELDLELTEEQLNSIFEDCE